MLNNDLKLMKLIDVVKNRGLMKYLVLGFSILIMVLILQKFFLLALLIGISLAISYSIGTFQMAKSVGVELVTFTSVLAGFAFGPTAGAIVGFILIVTHLIVGHFAAGIYILWTIPFYVATGILGSMMTGIDFATLGIYITIGINATSIILTAITFPQNLGYYIPFSITNIIFNLVIFTQFGPPIYSLIK